MIALIVILALVGAGLYDYGVRPLYESSAVISVREVTTGQGTATRLYRDATGIGALIEKQTARITSRELGTIVVKQLGDQERAELASGPLGPWYRRLRFGASPNQATEAPLSIAKFGESLGSRLQANWREPSPWIEVRVSGYNAEAVASLANALAAAYINETGEANREVIKASAAALNSQLAAKEEQLDQQLTGLRELGAETGLGDLNARKAMLDQRIRGFEGALVAAQTARVGRATTSREAALSDASGVAPADARVLAAQSRVSELEDREGALLATLGVQHPDVVTVREQLKSARKRLDTANDFIRKSAESAYELALREEARIAASLQRLQGELSDLEKDSLPYSLTQSRANASRAALEQLVLRQDLLAPLIVEAEIIQSALPAKTPFSPQKRQNLAYALVGGLLAGLLLSWGLDHFDDTVQTPDDIKDLLGMPFLGVVPFVPTLAKKNIAAAIADTRGGFSDGLRVVRTNLMFGTPGTRPKVLVFTSASPGEGKSTVSSGVALLLSEAQGRVLLIDGDLRRPSQESLHRLRKTAGLSSLLAAKKPVTLVVVPGPMPGMDILPAGPPITVSAARLGSENMRSLLEQARERYDWVIIDSPPSLGLPDASVLATMADGVVVVCSGDSTPRQALRSVGDQLNSLGIHLFGVVLNRVNMDRHSYYYGRHYSTYYSRK